MNLEHTIRTIPIDDNFQKTVDALVKEGWEIPPGILPVAVYHLVRVKHESAPPPDMGGFGHLSIDDSKIIVVPAGEKTN